MAEPASTGTADGISRMEFFLLRERGFAEKSAWLSAALIVATIARFAAGSVVTGVPLLFYLPAVLAVTLVAGWVFGVVALSIGTVLGIALFGQPTLFNDGAPLHTVGVTLIVWFVIACMIVAIVQFVRVALISARHNEMRFRKLLGAASSVIWVTDEAGNVLSPQSGWSDITGQEWPEYGGRGWLKAIHPDDHAALDELHPTGGSGDYNDVEVRVWNKSAADWRWYHARAVPIDSLFAKDEWITSFREIHDQKLSRDRRDLVIAELRHRMKNLVAIIDALAKGSRDRGEPAIEEFVKKFSGRLHALGAAADLILAGQRVSIECGALARATLAPFMEEKSSRITIEGGELHLSEQTGGTLGLAINEMATNALKYGALSAPNGIVSLRWSAVLLGNGNERIEIEWKERGGPRPVPPNKEGFGSRLIRMVPAQERDGEVTIDYQPDGLYCRIAFVRPAEGPPKAEHEPTRDAA